MLMRTNSLPTAEAADLIGAIGARERTGFAGAALRLADTALRVSHCTLFAHAGQPAGQGGAPRILSGASLDLADSFVFDVFHEYGAGLYTHDGNRRALQESRAPLLLRRQFRGEIVHSGYRRFYERGQMVDRVSVLVRAQAGAGLALNFYRDNRAGRYLDHELDSLRQLAPVLASAAERHYACLHPAPRPDWRARLTQIAPGLTPREQALMAGLLDGATLKAVARAMDIAPSTAATYRDRAYKRLGVRSLRDLPTRLM
jgi:DNA-binding CsgD family transcriptional regulator